MMPNRFSKHYTLAEARAMMPQVREWLERMNQMRHEYAEVSRRVDNMMDAQSDVGGSSVNHSIKLLSDIQGVLGEFKKHEIQVKDADRGLVDFPSRRGSREVFLCWEQSEDDIAHWHELDAGYDCREPL
ncbi:MAG: hypothetical protein CMO43_11620 [Verrucomicrobiales bacterium]|jgi:hypothetical protein|nr:hypothetical protein [Verrucomicrobiales bacterium]MDP6752090.1 DUF2203 domain-containing protein [Verrucomicrobiota bacterium]